MTESAVTYHPETIPAFKGIPTIECLPPRLSMTDLIKDLTKNRPEYHESDRMKSPEDRGMLTQILLRLYQPGKLLLHMKTSCIASFRLPVSCFLRLPMTPARIMTVCIGSMPAGIRF